jgi:hypothetical protein
LTRGDASGTLRSAMPRSTSLAGIFLHRGLWRGSLPWFLGAFIAVNAYVWFAEHRWSEARQANLLTPASALAGRKAGERPRYDWSIGEHLDEFWPDIPDARQQPFVILSGMSQMYAINDEQPGDEIIAELLDDKMGGDGIRVFGLAAPNLDNEEALLYLTAAVSDPRTTPRVFIYGVCFDKFRNLDVRPGLLEFMRKRPQLRQAWTDACSAHGPQYAKACDKMMATVRQADVVATAQAEDDSLESFLRAKLGQVVPVVHARASLNVEAQVQLFTLRNRLLGIKSTTKRPLLASRYDLNRELLELMSDVAREHHVQLVLYVIPLNPLAENPYVSSEYDAFKEWVASFAAERSLPFANLEGVVPREEWGLVNGEPDFKHFREAGHKRLAAVLHETFGPVLRSIATAPKP